MLYFLASSWFLRLELVLFMHSSTSQWQSIKCIIKKKTFSFRIFLSSWIKFWFKKSYMRLCCKHLKTFQIKFLIKCHQSFCVYTCWTRSLPICNCLCRKLEINNVFWDLILFKIRFLFQFLNEIVNFHNLPHMARTSRFSKNNVLALKKHLQRISRKIFFGDTALYRRSSSWGNTRVI